MSLLKIHIGGKFFSDIRKNNCCYIDKTDIISEFLNNFPPVATLITRPRRFGKTLTMSMLQEFFDIHKQSYELFEGLNIYKNKELCSSWMNKYPTIFVLF
ncbi:MAG: AAA family ATPase [Desulfovibrio sp.]|nr:AAA family ATPase [Desulfovibrio sp.]